MFIMGFKESIKAEIQNKRDDIDKTVSNRSSVSSFSIEESIEIERKLGEIDAYRKTLMYIDYFHGERI